MPSIVKTQALISHDIYSFIIDHASPCSDWMIHRFDCIFDDAILLIIDLDDVEIEERDYQMKKHYYSLFPLEIGVDSAHQSKIHPKFSSNDHHETDSRPLKNGDVFVHSTEALPATPTENLSTDVFENDTDFHGVMLLKESVGRHHPLLDECRASCRSETWSVEAEEVDIAHDDAILDKEDVFQQET